MWDMQCSCEHSEQLKATRRSDTQHEIIREIPEIYYRNTGKPIVVDKCRSWTLPPNMAMIREYITDHPKVVVLIRPLEEIVASFVHLMKKKTACKR